MIAKKRLTFQIIFDKMFTSTTQKKGNSVMAETAKNINYSDEMTAKVIEDYTNGVELETIADTVGKTVRSVRSKLVREGVYVAKPKTPSAKKNKEDNEVFNLF